MLRLCLYLGLLIFGRLMVGKRLGVDTAGQLSSIAQRDIPYNMSIPFTMLSHKSSGKGGRGDVHGCSVYLPNNSFFWSRDCWQHQASALHYHGTVTFLFFLWTWLGICLGNWILPSSLMESKKLLSHCTLPSLPHRCVCLCESTVAVAITVPCVILFSGFAEPKGDEVIAQCKRSDENLATGSLGFILQMYNLKPVMVFFHALSRDSFSWPQSYVSFHFLLLCFALAAVWSQFSCHRNLFWFFFNYYYFLSSLLYNEFKQWNTWYPLLPLPA